MKWLVLAIFGLASMSSYAAVEFTGSDWRYGQVESEIIQVVGISSNDAGETRVTLNLANERQVKLSGPHAAIGLALLGYQGKCIKIIPGKQLSSVSFILQCE